MITCRYKNSPNSPGPSHVHDDPGSMVDAFRCEENGWEVHVDGTCYHPELAHSSGDIQVKFTTIIDIIKQ